MYVPKSVFTFLAVFLLLSVVNAVSGVDVNIEASAGNIEQLDVESVKVVPESHEPIPGEKFEFQAEVSRLMDIIINSLYSNKDIFLRELISNASDALDKLRFLSLTDASMLGEGEDAELKIEIIPNAQANTLTIRDSGVGMSKEELIKNLGTVARSGTSKFLEAATSGQDALSLIGQFGVGFYSAFLVADKVSVTSKRSGGSATTWESTAKDTFSIYEPESDSIGHHGTSITLYLMDDAKEYLEQSRIEEIAGRYSEFINFPIFLYTTKTEKEEIPLDEDELNELKETENSENEGEELDVSDEEEDDTPKTKTIEKVINVWKKLNENKPLWTKSKDDITEEEYNEFFKTTYGESMNPLTWTHFSAEGGTDFTSLMYIPAKASRDLYDNYYQSKGSLKLYVRRVLIADEFEDFMPRYLSFIKGIVDSDDLPINVSRETLQKSKVLQVIAKRLVRKAIQMLESLAKTTESDDEESEDQPEEADIVDESKEDKYKEFWNEYGKSIKLGVLEDQKNKRKLIKLLRFPSSKSGEGITSFTQYVKRMKEKQENIYYISGENLESVRGSPMLEELEKRDLEVLYFVDPLDEYLTQSLNEFDGFKLMSVSKEGLKFGDEDDQDDSELEKEFFQLCDWFTQILGKRVEKVQISRRISVSPAVVVTAQWGWSANMERIMKAQPLGDDSMRAFLGARKTLEINPNSDIILKLKEQIVENPNDPSLKESAELIFDTALLSSGFAPEEPLVLVKRIQRAVSSSLDLDVQYPEFPQVTLNTPKEKEVATEDDIELDDVIEHDEL